MPLRSDLIATAAQHGLRMLGQNSVEARAANKRIRATVRPDTDGRVPFQCECGRDYCRRYVWLSLAEVAEYIDGGKPIIAAHPPT